MSVPTQAELRDQLADILARRELVDADHYTRDYYRKLAGRAIRGLDLLPEADGRGGWRLVTPWTGTEHVM